MEKQLLKVCYNDEKNCYDVNVGKDSSVAEVAFEVGVIIRCFVKSELIKTPDEFLKLVDKYLNDPQYDELKEVDDGPTETTESDRSEETV